MNNYIDITYQEMYLEDVYQIYLEEFIREKQAVFLEEIRGESAKGSTYRMDVDTSYYHGIASIHLVMYVYSGGAHDIRFDRIYYYDLEMGKEVALEDLLTLNSSFYVEIQKYALEQLLSEKTDVIYEDENLILEGLQADKSHFKYFMFLKDGIQILFPPYQVGPWSSGEISVSIPYQSIAKYLKI